MNINNAMKDVKVFHDKFNSKLTGDFETSSKRELRIKLLKEEFEEYLEGEANNDVVEIADALGDMLYIIYGTCLEYGIPIQEVFSEIQRSNLTKSLEKREDGKVKKGPDYEPPQIEKVLQVSNLKGKDFLDKYNS